LTNSAETVCGRLRSSFIVSLGIWSST
jgi:hypothetical protein